MTMASKQIILKHYKRILTSWPVDKLRPDVTFQKCLQRRMDNRLGPSSIFNSVQDNSNDAHVVAPTPVPFDEKAELEQVNALYSFLENRYTKKYPLPERMMKPASNPTHYDDLVKELEEAPNRSWFASKINSWKGFLRLS